MALDRQDELDGLADGRAAVDARQDDLRRQQQAGAFEVGGREVALALGRPSTNSVSMNSPISLMIALEASL